MFLLWFRNNRTQKLFAMDIFSLGDQNLLIKAVYLFWFTTSRAILLISALITCETMKPSRFNFTYATGYMHLEILCSFHFHLYFQCFFSFLFSCPNQAWNFDAKISVTFLFQIFLGISAGVGLIAGLLTLCLFYVGLFVLGKCFLYLLHKLVKNVMAVSANIFETYIH